MTEITNLRSCPPTPNQQRSDHHWLFTPVALRLLLLRSGWIVKDEFCVGDAQTATPVTGDCRMFRYCERIDNWQDLRLHHDF